MPARSLSWLFLFMVLCVSTSAWSARPDFVPAHIVDDARSSYIFIFTSRVTTAQVAVLSNRFAAQEGVEPRYIFTTAIKGFSATLPEVAARRIAASPQVSYYERNGVVWAVGLEANKRPANPGKGGGDSAVVPQTVPYGIARVGGPLDGTGKHAWVIDTGIDTGHLDLNVGSGANFVYRGKSTVEDGNGHGTHVAGTIAALNNSIDVVGVAAGATVHPVRVLDNSGSGTIDGVIAGVVIQ